MATFTVSIPREVKDEIDKFPEIDLAKYLRKRLKERLEEMKENGFSHTSNSK